ncbi:MAG: transglutaminase domain-containing protein [Myxococcaceae bacterium]
MKNFILIWALALPVLSSTPAQLISQYENDLFPYTDPFVRVQNLEQGQLIFDKLKTFKPLALVSDALVTFHSRSVEPDANMIQFVMEQTEKVITSSGYSKLEKQSNLLALYYLRDYLSRFEQKEAVDRDGVQAGENKKKQDPKHPEMPEEYKPTTKDTEKDKEPGSKDEQVVILETNFATPYLGQRTYAEVVRHAAAPFKSIELPTQLPTPEAYKNTGKEMSVYMLGETEITLFIPPGYEPRQPEDSRARITRSSKGAYHLKVSEVLLLVTIPLQPTSSHNLSPVLHEIYTRPVGFLDSEWPALIRSDLFDKKFSNSLTTAEAVSKHLATKYLYSVGARPETDPVDALNAGAFQCDMAAYLMVGILRDVYKIPSRVVSGYRAKKHGNGKNQRSYLVLPGDAHAWVEVYDNGIWRPMDPTPILKDKEKEDEEKGEKDEYSDRELEDQPKPESKNLTPNPSPPSGEGNKSETSAGNSTLSMDSEELASMLTLGSLELNPSEDSDPLRDRAIRVLLRLILDPNLDGVKTYERLYQSRQLFLSISELKSLVQELLVIHEKKHPNLKTWLEDILVFLDQRDLPTTYQNIYRIKKSLELYAKLLDKNMRYPSELLDQLDGILRDIYGLSHSDSAEIAMVAEFYDSLPSLVQTLLAQQYGLIRVGPNAPTKEVARLLKGGTLNDLKLLAILSPLTEFILNSTPRPEFEEVRTWTRDSRRLMGNDLLPLNRFSDLTRSLITKPGQDLEKNLREGNIYTRTHRQRIDVPTGFGKDDAERITIVLYDTSGSMYGDPERFQAGLISAFTARALSDLAPSGAHRHRIVLVPFDDKPGNPVKVTNTQEALDIIHNYRSKLANTAGGTDIQAALIQAMALIADAERRSGEPLAAANIILMTDGQSPLDIPKLAEARSAIDRTTPLQIMFVAIGTSNDELVKFVQDSEKAGIETGFYREFNSGLMSEYMKKADAPPAQGSADKIYTEKTSRDLSPQTRNSLIQALQLMSEFSLQVQQASTYTASQEHLRALETSTWSKPESVARPLQVWIQNLRRMAYGQVFRSDLPLRAQVADDIWKHFDKLTGVSMQHLSQNEWTELKHYYCHAAALGALGCP